MSIVMIIYVLLPFCVSLMYNFFYNKHINKHINDEQKKPWISPIATFFITLSIEFLIFMILFILFSVKSDYTETSSQIAIHQYDYSLYTDDEISNSIYSIFNGDDVNGYTKSVGLCNDFSYILYSCDYSLNSSPEYVLITTYSKDIDNKNSSAMLFIRASNKSTQNTEITGLNEGSQYSNTIYHVIDSGEYQNISIQMYLFDHKQDPKEIDKLLSDDNFDITKTEEAAKSRSIADFSISL